MQHEYMLKNYDYIVIVSSWGTPREYRKSHYVMELVTTDGKRLVEPRGGDSQYDCTQYSCLHSSTLAIARILEKIGIENSKIKILIFAQDTILLNTMIDEWKQYSTSKVKTRKDLEKDLGKELYEQNIEVARELGVNDSEDYLKLVKFVPGVISSARGAELYTWRGEHIYDVMLGSIALYTYMKLREFGNARRVAMVLDTTHGINYFVTALKEGVSIGASLYAFSRATDLLDTGLDELVIYHYNSDPVMKDECADIPSLKLHLLNETPIVKSGNLNPNAIFSHVETQVLIRGVEVFENQLSRLWGSVDWGNVIETLLLFSKGVLSWALRNTIALKDPGSKLGETTLMSAIEEIKLRFEERAVNIRKLRQITYDLGKNVPSIHIVVPALLLNALRNLAEKIMVPVDKDIKSNIENLAKRLEAETSTKEISETLKDFLKENFICLDLDALMNAVKRLYLSPHREINENEFRNLKEYLQDKEPHWNLTIDKPDLKIYEEPSRGTYLVVHDNIRLIISREKQIELRNFLAHAGLAYGLKWLSLGINNKYIICLGDPSKPAKLIRQASTI